MARYTGFHGRQPPQHGHANGGDVDQEGDREQRTGFGGATDGRTSPPVFFNPYYTGRPRTPANGTKPTPIDRQEIIRRIKNGESRPTSPEMERPPSRSSFKKRKSHSPEQAASHDSPPREKLPEASLDNQAIGMQIERPRSAFHRGDFREKEESKSGFERFHCPSRCEHAPPLSTSPVAPWHSDFPTAASRRSQPMMRSEISPMERPIPRTRATSNASLANSFVYKAPTSPLVQASRPDTPDPPSRQMSPSPDKSRRHTFSPPSLQRFQSALEYPSSARTQTNRQPPPLRAERTFPYQAHQPRRSLNSFSNLPHSPPARKPSLTETPLHHAPMVGSYEESILRGRMSTTPSKPLNFVAQIGVLGKGDCKPNLRCPPHATVPFPAVFYSYGTGNKPASTTDPPSPYVGLIDLENNLPPASTPVEKRRPRPPAPTSTTPSPRISSPSPSEPHLLSRRRHRQKATRRSTSPRAPPGGSYRIPPVGQLQIVLKNPNKTAVKLFLVPYDLSDMDAGTKTFIRQRSYSASAGAPGPLDTHRRNLDTNQHEAAEGGDDTTRPTLRYLVHLHICSPSRGRYFLYKSVRVVFANRVPDGKEALRNEIQLPEPRYSAYKPARDVAGGMSGSQSRRRSGAMASEPAPDDDGMMADASPSPSTVPGKPHSRGAQSLPAAHVSHRNPFSPREAGAAWARGDPREEEHEHVVFERSQRGHGRSESLLSRRLRGLGVEACGYGDGDGDGNRGEGWGASDQGGRDGG